MFGYTVIETARDESHPLTFWVRGNINRVESWVCVNVIAGAPEVDAQNSSIDGDEPTNQVSKAYWDQMQADAVARVMEAM